MKCPHCLVEFHDNKDYKFSGNDSQGQWMIERYKCPNPDCKKDIYFLLKGEFSHGHSANQWYVKKDENDVEKVFKRELIRPKDQVDLQYLEKFQ